MGVKMPEKEYKWTRKHIIKKPIEETIAKAKGESMSIIYKLIKTLQRKSVNMFKRTRSEVSPEITPIDLFNRCVNIICSCRSPEQRQVARHYVELAAQKAYPKIQDDWDREMYIKAIDHEVLNGLFATIEV